MEAVHLGQVANRPEMRVPMQQHQQSGGLSKQSVSKAAMPSGGGHMEQHASSRPPFGNLALPKQFPPPKDKQAATKAKPAPKVPKNK